MNEDDVGKVFLIAWEWDWTTVGRFRGFIGGARVFDECGYFTRTGATFDQLAAKGFVKSGDHRTHFHMLGEWRTESRANVILPWKAEWPQKEVR